MNKFDRVRVRGTEVTGTILEIENKRDFDQRLVLFVIVALDTGSIMIYDVSEVKYNLRFVTYRSSTTL